MLFDIRGGGSLLGEGIEMSTLQQPSVTLSVMDSIPSQKDALANGTGLVSHSLVGFSTSGVVKPALEASSDLIRDWTVAWGAKHLLLGPQVCNMHKSFQYLGPPLRGSFADVYPASWMGSSIPVAVKKFHLTTLPKHLESEFDSYQTLRFPHLVTFYGFSGATPGHFLAIFEFCDMNLQTYYKSVLKDQGFGIGLNMRVVVRILYELACAMNFLHTNLVSHGHLKSSNVFIHGNCLKLGDWGLSKIKLESSSCGASQGDGPTIRWRGCETFTRDYARNRMQFPVRASSDLASYGLILYEVCHGLIPYHDSLTEASVVALKNRGSYPCFDAFGYPLELQSLYQQCIHSVPSERGTFLGILRFLNTIPSLCLSEAKLTPF